MKRISKNVFVKTFGCIQNSADSEKIKAYYWNLGYKLCDSWKEAALVVINSCIIRESAENRVYGLIDKINKFNKTHNSDIKIVVTGCLVGAAVREKSGQKLRRLRENFGSVDNFLPIEKISYDIEPLRNKIGAALIPISNGCNNFCSYCIVPFARGEEVSRPFKNILDEVDSVIDRGFREVVLIGQNVNSYGSDLVKNKLFVLPDGTSVSPIMVRSMGKSRVPTLFPYLLEEVAKKKLDKISFVSSNPWDFSDELIETIAQNNNIDRLIHLPLQSGDDEILKLMNRGYSAKDYLALVKKIKSKIDEVRISTDIIIGFPGETEEKFLNTVKVCKQADFEIAYLNKYSPRIGTVSAKLYKDEITQAEKRKRWNVLNELINK